MTRARAIWRGGLLLSIASLSTSGAWAWSGDPGEILRQLMTSPQYSLTFNLAVFFTLFLGVFLRPLKDRLGRAGTVVAVALALMMSAALAITGRFHLLDLEPFAGLAIFTLLGAVVGVVFRRFYEASFATVAAVSFVVGYGSMRMAAPGLLPVAEEFFIVPGLLYVVAIVWLIYSFSTQAFPVGGPAASWQTHAARTLSARPPQARQRIQEASEAQNALSDVASVEMRDHAVVLAEIEETQRSLKAADAPELRSVVSGRLVQLTQAQRKVESEYAGYKALTERIEALDAVEYADLKRTLEELPETVQAEARAELAGINKNLNTDRVLKNLGQAVEANNLAVRNALERAQAELSAGRVKTCLQALNDARTAEAEAERLMAQIKRFADRFKAAAAKVVARSGTKATELVAGR